MSALFAGGNYDLIAQPGGEVPVFVFTVADFDAARAQVADMYIDLELRRATNGQIAMHLDVADRAFPPWAIDIPASDLVRLGRAETQQNGCGAIIVGPQRQSMDLAAFATGRRHDWTGRFADALKAFNAGSIDSAQQTLEALLVANPSLANARHLLGRCHRSRELLAGACEHYLAAVMLSVSRRDGTFIPYAAGVLSDMGVAYKRMGQFGRAALCFQHSLAIRPNHPASLATYVTMFAQWYDGLLFAVSRILAIGGSESLVAQLVAMGSQTLAIDPRDIQAEGEIFAKDVDLAAWPWPMPNITGEQFVRELHHASGDPQRPSIRSARSRSA